MAGSWTLHLTIPCQRPAIVDTTPAIVETYATTPAIIVADNTTPALVETYDTTLAIVVAHYTTPTIEVAFNTALASSNSRSFT